MEPLRVCLAVFPLTRTSKEGNIVRTAIPPLAWAECIVIGSIVAIWNVFGRNGEQSD